MAMALFAPLLSTHDPNEIIEEEEGTVVALVDGAWRVNERLGELALSGIDSRDGLAVTVGRLGSVFVNADGSWERIEVPVETDLNEVSIADDGTILVVGDASTALLIDPQGGATVLEVPVTANLNGVTWLDGDSALLVGARETILLYSRADGSFTELDSPLGRGITLNKVAREPDGSGLIVGERGLVIEYRDSGLTQLTMPSFRDFNDVSIAANGSALIVGERGTLVLRTADGWVEAASPDSRALRAAWIGEDGAALAAGRNGVLLSLAAGGTDWVRIELDTERHFRALGLVGGAPVALGSDAFVNKLAPPSTRHWFGTDHLGRDLYSQNVYGSRIALLVGFLGATLVVLIGTNVGLFAGYFRGRTDTILMRTVDVMYGIPFEPFAMILVLLFHPSLTIVIVAVSLLTWRTVARLIRSQVLSLAERPFVKAARVAGASDMRILYLHIAPNILPLVLLQLAIIVGSSIIAEATLSFLGLGPPQSISWGGILHNARLSGAWRTAWWWNIPPGALIMLTVLGVFFISRSLEVLSNPRLRSR